MCVGPLGALTLERRRGGWVKGRGWWIAGLAPWVRVWSVYEEDGVVVGGV